MGDIVSEPFLLPEGWGDFVLQTILLSKTVKEPPDFVSCSTEDDLPGLNLPCDSVTSELEEALGKRHAPALLSRLSSRRKASNLNKMW